MVTKVRDEKEYDLNPRIRRIIADITPEEETGSRIHNLLARINKLRRIWKEVKPDVIVSFIRKNNLMAIAFAVPLGIPVVVSVRSAPERELKGFGFKTISFLLFRRAAGVILQTREAYDFFPGYIRAKAVVLPNSINPEFLKASEELETQGDGSSTNSARKKKIITVGRIDDNKNQKLFVDAYARIAMQYPDWSLELVGDGSGKKSLEEYVRTLLCKDRINFTGAVDDVVKRMSEASIFVLPSKIDGMHNALIEAMALKRLITNDTLRESMGDNARKIMNTLHPDTVNKQWKNYIENVMISRA